MMNQHPENPSDREQSSQKTDASVNPETVEYVKKDAGEVKASKVSPKRGQRSRSD